MFKSRKIRYYLSLFSYINIQKTIIWNFRLFPFKIAIKIPLLIGYRVDFIGVKRDSIKLNSSNISTGMVKIGISRFPTIPSKGLYTLITISRKSTITFGENVTIRNGCSLIAIYDGHIIIGNDVSISQCTIIYSNSEIKIGNHTSIGWKTQLYDTAFHCLIDIDTGNISNPSKRIFIGNNVWIANHVTISAGANIPHYTIVASHTLVNKNYNEEGGYIGGLLYGIPAKYKNFRKVRLLNQSLEYKLKADYFLSDDVESVNIVDLGFNVEPFNPTQNIMYRRK